MTAKPTASKPEAQSAPNATERRTNLTFAFLNAERLGRPILTTSWVIDNVDGYAKTPTGEPRSKEAAKRMFLRDCRVLVAAGVPIEQVATNQQSGYRLQADTYQLPPVRFTPQEGAALAVASQLASHGELSGFSRSGWQKLAAAGVQRELGVTTQLQTYSDLQTVSALDLDAILRATSGRRPVQFTYTAHLQAEPQTRTLDPWGLITRADRLYLAGFCHDRKAPRTFRIRRIADVKVLPPSDEFRDSEGVNLQALLSEQLRRGRALCDATIRLRGTAPAWFRNHLDEASKDLVGHGQQPSNVEVSLHDVDRDLLIREAIAGYPNIVVTSPADVRQDIRARLFDALHTDAPPGPPHANDARATSEDGEQAK